MTNEKPTVVVGSLKANRLRVDDGQRIFFLCRRWFVTTMRAVPVCRRNRIRRPLGALFLHVLLARGAKGHKGFGFFVESLAFLIVEDGLLQDASDRLRTEV